MTNYYHIGSEQNILNQYPSLSHQSPSFFSSLPKKQPTQYKHIPPSQHSYQQIVDFPQSIIFVIDNQRIMLKQPSTNVKMTNVATIRYKINNKHFQIACYRNKAMNWRNGVEDDVSQVLQTDQIFQNASHGTIAKKADLKKFFPNKTKLEIIQIILQRGQLQITDKERESQQSGTLAEIINIIVEKCVHPVTRRRFSAETIKQAIKQIHFSVKTDQPAKKQALQCIKQLQTKYKIARGDMRVKITFKKESEETILQELKTLGIDKVFQEEAKGEILVKVYDIEPNKYRELNLMCKKNNDVTVEVLVNVVVNESTKQIENGVVSFLEMHEGAEKKQEEEETKIEKGNNAKKQKKVQEKVLTCSTCGELAIFSTPADQRAHFKSEWHVENVKRKSKNLALLSEQQFNFNQTYA